MKKITLIFLLAINNLFAQDISQYYTVSQNSLGSGYNFLFDSGTTHILDGQNSDGGEATIDIGFDFEYAGTVYTQLTIGVNGALTFTGSDVFGGNDLAGTATNVTDIIAVLWDDLYQRTADDGFIHYKLQGTAPNRYLEIEWRDISWWHTGSTVSFRVILKETTNDITMYYADVDVAETGGEIGASIGLNAGTSGDNFISVTPGSPATISSITANNTIMPSDFNTYTSYKKYTFKYGPHNDACADAIVIDPNGYTNTQIMNGTDNNDGFITPSGCGDGMNDGVWYTFTPDYDGEIVVAVTADDFDVEIGVYTGSCGSFSCVGFADSHGGTGSSSTETAIFDVLAGTQYWVNAGAYYSALDFQETGNITINVNYSPPVNDLCADAIEISCGDTLDGINVGATATGETTCGLSTGDKGVWYHFAPVNGGGVTAIWTTANFDTKLAVYSGSCGSLTCIANDDDTNGTQPYIEIETLPETDYYIYVVGFSTFSGEFSLNVSCTPPSNDEASGAILMNVGAVGSGCTSPTTVWNNNGATSSESINAVPSCANYLGGDLWYKFVVPASGGVRLLRASAGDWGTLGYALYDSPNGDNSDIITCDLIGTNTTEGNPVTGLIVGNTYYLRIWEYNNNDFGSVGICLEEVSTAAVGEVLQEVRVYPNPTRDTVMISMEQQDNYTITVYNLLGKQVLSQTISQTNEAQIALTNLPNGVYMMRVFADSSKEGQTIRIIKK